MTKKILISGASIAGPTAALVLGRKGFDVTIVEKSNSLRGGGYAIDIRAAAIEVVRRLGLLDQLSSSHLDMREWTFIDNLGNRVGPFDPELVLGGVRGTDIEVPRGDLATVVYAATKDIVTYRFNDSISRMQEDGDGVAVTFASGENEKYDLVIGADGLHSNVRAQIFGPETQFERYMGYCFMIYTTPNVDGGERYAEIYNAPGKMAYYAASRAEDPRRALLAFRYPESPFRQPLSAERQKEITAENFVGEGWQVPMLIDKMHQSDDIYFDAISQIRMPNWSKGRVVLTGDSAHATSFLSGQGSSVALVGSYVLANEIALHDDHRTAFANYERIVRGFAEANQDLVGDGSWAMVPATAEDLAQRNAAITAAIADPGAAKDVHGEQARPVYNAIELPNYV